MGYKKETFFQFDGKTHVEDRYHFDFNACNIKKGFAQIDDRQDAPYYGQWANPAERKYVSYCEGDVMIMTFDNDAEFAEFIRKLSSDANFKGIDPGCDHTNPVAEGFKRVGLGDLLH